MAKRNIVRKPRAAAAQETPGLLEASLPRPLAEVLRPARLSQVLGQDALLGADGALARILRADALPSLILWGPPGSGKTTIAKLLAHETRAEFTQISAVFSGVADLRAVFAQARERRRAGQITLLFVDEIHRFNRAQQDSFLPYVEDGTITLIGATTENPSFELNAPLLSRCRVLVLERLDDAALGGLLQRAEEHTGRTLPLQKQARDLLAQLADGDGRYLLNLAEALFALPARTPPLNEKELVRFVQKRAPLYDKNREAHYNLISALHKSMRGSDPDAALYWLARMFEGGEDPNYIARRLVRFAIEDVALARAQALPYAIAAWQTYERLGSPEGELALANLVLLLASAPKSNAAYDALERARHAAAETGSLMPPKHILNAPTKMMKNLGYAEGYRYDHDEPDEFSGQNYFPEEMERLQFYKPKGAGAEAEIKERLARWNELRRKRNS